MIRDRVTHDIDGYRYNFALTALKVYYGLKRLPAVEEVVVHISTGGKGLHIEGHLSERLSDAQRESLRRTLGDDAKRLHLDCDRTARGHAGDIFWTSKEGNEGERERMEDIWAALDRIEATRASDHARVKALAQHGRKGVWDTFGINRASKGVRE